MKAKLFFSVILFSVVLTSCFYKPEDIIPEPEILQDSTTYFYFADSANYLMVNYVSGDSFRILKASPSFEGITEFTPLDSKTVWTNGVILNQIPKEFGQIDYENKISVPNLRYIPEMDILIGVEYKDKIYINKSNYLYKSFTDSVHSEVVLKNTKTTILWYDVYFHVEDETIYPETGQWLIKKSGGQENVFFLDKIYNIVNYDDGSTKLDLINQQKEIGTAYVLE